MGGGGGIKIIDFYHIEIIKSQVTIMGSVLL